MPKLHSLIRTARRSEIEAPINLNQKRVWFGEGDGAGDQQQGQQGDGELPTTVEGWQKYGEALKKRLAERDSKIETLSRVNGDLDGRLKTIEQAQRKQLEQDGNFKTLADQHAAEVARLKPIEERAAALDKIIRESNESRIAAVPEQMRGLIPLDYPPEKLQIWLSANQDKLTKPPAADYDAGAGSGSRGGSPPPKLTDFEREIARATGVSEKEYAEMKQQRGQPIELSKKPTT